MSPSPVGVGVRRCVCTAGVAALLFAGSPCGAFADGVLGDLPDGPGWDPGAPPIEGGGEAPSEPDPTPPSVPEEPTTPSEPEDPGYTEPDPGLPPDSGSGGPDYNYEPPSSGGAGAASEWAFYDPAEPPTAEEQPQENVQEPAAAPTVPVFGTYDPTTGMLTGTAQPGSTVRVVDAAGNVIADVAVGEDGTFAVTLPAGTDLGSLSIYGINENGEATTEALMGATIQQELARRELEQVRTAVGASTVELADELRDDLAAAGIASSVLLPEDASMPVLPYVLGAASAAVALGAVAGGVVAWRRHRDAGSERPVSLVQVPAGPAESTVRPDIMQSSGAFSAVAADRGETPILDHTADFAPGDVRSAAPIADGDELERLAMGFAATPRASYERASQWSDDDPDDDPTPPRGPTGGPAPSAGDTAMFLAVAPAPAEPAKGGGLAGASYLHVVAGGRDRGTTSTGPVVAAPQPAASHLTGFVREVPDLSGLDAFDYTATPASPAVAADPLTIDDDWRAVALNELANAGVAAASVRRLSTDDYVALVSTQRRAPVEASGASLTAAYVAPVVGPSAVDAEAARRRHALLRSSQTPQAVALRERDEAFKTRRQESAPVASCTGSFDGVPTIARGTARSTPGPAVRSATISQRIPIERQSLSVPDPSLFAPVPPAPSEPFISERGVAAAVLAARNVYAAYAPASTVTRRSPSLGVPAIEPVDVPAHVYEAPAPSPAAVSSSVAAAYAAAVYGKVSVPDQSLPVSLTGQLAATGRPASPVGRTIPAVEIEGDFSDPGETASGYSAAYINYMVQDEFEHRHDTPAQRNAALRHMHVVNGAANAPVPLKEGLRRRHLA